MDVLAIMDDLSSIIEHNKDVKSGRFDNWK
jgi:hypothetical protein